MPLSLLPLFSGRALLSLFRALPLLSTADAALDGSADSASCLGTTHAQWTAHGLGTAEAQWTAHGEPSGGPACRGWKMHVYFVTRPGSCNPGHHGKPLKR
eukprot:3618870-Amphidinium_carterae.1